MLGWLRGTLSPSNLSRLQTCFPSAMDGDWNADGRGLSRRETWHPSDRRNAAAANSRGRAVAALPTVGLLTGIGAPEGPRPLRGT